MSEQNDEQQKQEKDTTSSGVSADQVGGVDVNSPVDRTSGASAKDTMLHEVNTLTPEAGNSVGEEQVQAKIDEETARGYRGVKVDPTPNRNYSAENSAPQNDLPTPETEPDMRQYRRENSQLDGPKPY